MIERTCTVDGCDKPLRSTGAEWCKMHYHRWYRHGSVETVAAGSGVTASHGRRYRIVRKPTHPLASKHGIVYVHRMVLFDAIGYGPHACHWCGVEVDWLPKGDPRCLQADHLNSVGDDNRIGNLVPACGRCNTTRGAQARHDALRDQGWWSQNDTVAHLNRGGRVPRVA